MPVPRISPAWSLAYQPVHRADGTAFIGGIRGDEADRLAGDAAGDLDGVRREENAALALIADQREVARKREGHADFRGAGGFFWRARGPGHAAGKRGAGKGKQKTARDLRHYRTKLAFETRRCKSGM